MRKDRVFHQDPGVERETRDIRRILEVSSETGFVEGKEIGLRKGFYMGLLAGVLLTGLVTNAYHFMKDYVSSKNDHNYGVSKLEENLK